jgi:ankyrin repeat protein
MKSCRKILPLLITVCLLGPVARAAPLKAADYYSQTKELAIAAAAENNDASKIRELKAAGVDVNAHGRGNLTPLYLAATSRSKKAFECLLELGADPNVQFQETGASALAIAAAMADSSFLSQALAHGGKPNQVNPTTGLTPIWRSMDEMLPNNVKILAAEKADVNFANSNGVTYATHVRCCSQSLRHRLDPAGRRSRPWKEKQLGEQPSLVHPSQPGRSAE